MTLHEFIFQQEPNYLCVVTPIEIICRHIQNPLSATDCMCYLAGQARDHANRHRSVAEYH